MVQAGLEFLVMCVRAGEKFALSLKRLLSRDVFMGHGYSVSPTALDTNGEFCTRSVSTTLLPTDDGPAHQRIRGGSKQTAKKEGTTGQPHASSHEIRGEAENPGNQPWPAAAETLRQRRIPQWQTWERWVSRSQLSRMRTLTTRLRSTQKRGKQSQPRRVKRRATKRRPRPRPN